MRTRIGLAVAAVLLLSLGASAQQYRYGDRYGDRFGNRYRQSVPDRDDARYYERGFQNGYRHAFDGLRFNDGMPLGVNLRADRGDRKAYEKGYKNGYREGRQERRRLYRR